MKEQAPPRTGEIGAQAESLHRRRHPARGLQPRGHLLAQPGSSLLSTDLSLPNKLAWGRPPPPPPRGQSGSDRDSLTPEQQVWEMEMDAPCKKCPSVQHPWGTLHTEAPS